MTLVYHFVSGNSFALFPLLLVISITARLPVDHNTSYSSICRPLADGVCVFVSHQESRRILGSRLGGEVESDI